MTLPTMENSQSTLGNTPFQEPTTKTTENAPLPNDSEINNSDIHTIQSFSLTFDERDSELSSPQTNDPSNDELSIPREIISRSLSTSKLQSELRRPILSGTYFDSPAYLLEIKFLFQVPDNDSWLKRIQQATITIVLEDAPPDGTAQPSTHALGRRKRPSRQATQVKHPSIVQTYPSDNSEGWSGPISTMSVSNSRGAGLQAGYMGIGASINHNQTRTRDRKGTARVATMRTGSQRNCLIVTVTENSVDAQGIPQFLVIPVILTHHNRRFVMRVTVNATFGFWRGKLASIPVLGRADEPLCFDPEVMQGKMERGEKGIGGVRIVEKCGRLDEVDLKKYSSLPLDDEVQQSTINEPVVDGLPIAGMEVNVAVGL